MLLLLAAAMLDPQAAVPERTVCVPLRDRAGKATGGQACRTPAQWQAILAANNHRAGSADSGPGGAVFADGRDYNSSQSPPGGFARSR